MTMYTDSTYSPVRHPSHNAGAGDTGRARETSHSARPSFLSHLLQEILAWSAK